MKTLTVRQPYAAAIAAGLKQYETRPPNVSRTYRGDLIIHAGKGKGALNWTLVTGLSAAQNRELDRLRTITGAALCIVEVVDIVPVESVRDQIDPFEKLFGDYSDGRMAWKLANVRLLSYPLEANGQLGLWNWKTPEEITHALEYQEFSIV